TLAWRRVLHKPHDSLSAVSALCRTQQVRKVPVVPAAQSPADRRVAVVGHIEDDMLPAGLLVALDPRNDADRAEAVDADLVPRDVGILRSLLAKQAGCPGALLCLAVGMRVEWRAADPRPVAEILDALPAVEGVLDGRQTGEEPDCAGYFPDLRGVFRKRQI